MLYHNLFIFFFYFHLFYLCNSHGYLADPPARSSAWLFDKDFATCCQYYNHAEMFCGGVYHQWVLNGGKCSICGEAYDAKPQLLGRGDAMYLGKIVRTYTQGSIIRVTVVLTANHRGLFEFRICKIDSNSNEDATQECLNSNLLTVVNGSTHYEVESTFSTIHINVSLPKDLTCKHCVFQWKYITGNSWGVANGQSCLGCGSQNEEFYGCADVAIIGKTNEISAIVDSVSTTNTMIKMTSHSQKCTLRVSFSRLFDLTALVTQYCHTICSNNCTSEKRENIDDETYNNCKKSCDILCDCK